MYQKVNCYYIKLFIISFQQIVANKQSKEPSEKIAYMCVYIYIYTRVETRIIYNYKIKATINGIISKLVIMLAPQRTSMLSLTKRTKLRPLLARTFNV